MDALIYKEETFQLVGLCMEIHRELGKGQDEIIYLLERCWDTKSRDLVPVFPFVKISEIRVNTAPVVSRPYHTFMSD